MKAIPCARYVRYMASFAGNCKEAGRDGGKNVARSGEYSPALDLGGP
jgi:hypothetical protein